MVRFIIKKSISSGMRTKGDWVAFRKQQKAIEENNLVSKMKKTLKKPKLKIRTACSRDSPRVPDEKPTHVPCRSC